MPAKRRHLTRGLTLAALCLAVLACMVQLAWPSDAPPASKEAQIKAAIVFNIARFTKWPVDSAWVDYSRVVGVLGTGPVVQALLEIDGQATADRAFHVRRVTSPEDAHACQLVYFGETDSGLCREYLRVLDNAPVLTVSEGERFTSESGMVQMAVRDHRVHLSVLLSRVKRARLKLSAQLLRIAEIVEESEAAAAAR